MNARPVALPCCALCPRLGIVRKFKAMSVRLCSPCAAALELSASVPGEIERDVSMRFEAIRVAS